MKLKIFLLSSILLIIQNVYSQRYFTRTGEISFYSKTKVEDIEAVNKSVNSILDINTGDIQFSVIMRSFEFKKALMEEHFNENYVESDKYPKSIFRGKIKNISDIDWKKNRDYNVNVQGIIELHGEKKELNTPATITIKNGNILTMVSFKLTLSDFKIEIPSLVKDKIQNEIQIHINATYEILRK